MSSRSLTIASVGQLIERFIENRQLYPQEWNDFVERRQTDAAVEVVRKHCYELDPLVNRPGKMNEDAEAELKFVVALTKALASSSAELGRL